nr:CFF_HP1_G0031200.mRNA.1.CDS.1 [Saccharomyces cerevisiae]
MQKAPFPSSFNRDCCLKLGDGATNSDKENTFNCRNTILSRNTSLEADREQSLRKQMEEEDHLKRRPSHKMKKPYRRYMMLKVGYEIKKF